MPFYEIVYEPGTKSVAFYEDDEEATNALTAHHSKALSGEPATPQSETRSDLGATLGAVGTWAAERVSRVYVYPEHPASFEPPIDTSSLEGKSPQEMITSIRDQANPVEPNSSAHESQYKMEAERELDLGFLNEAGTP